MAQVVVADRIALRNVGLYPRCRRMKMHQSSNCWGDVTPWFRSRAMSGTTAFLLIC